MGAVPPCPTCHFAKAANVQRCSQAHSRIFRIRATALLGEPRKSRNEPVGPGRAAKDLAKRALPAGRRPVRERCHSRTRCAELARHCRIAALVLPLQESYDFPRLAVSRRPDRDGRSTKVGVGVVDVVVDSRWRPRAFRSGTARGGRKRFQGRKGTFRVINSEDRGPSGSADAAPDDLRVLLVDAQARVLRFMAFAFASNDCLVSTASNAESALDFLAREPCDLVVTDLDLTGTSGLDLLTAVKDPVPDDSRRPHDRLAVARFGRPRPSPAGLRLPEEALLGGRGPAARRAHQGGPPAGPRADSRRATRKNPSAGARP